VEVVYEESHGWRKKSEEEKEDCEEEVREEESKRGEDVEARLAWEW
jgi:hypothetical protein